MAGCRPEPANIAPGDSYQLQQFIEQAYAGGYAYHGDIGVAPESFAGRLMAVVERHVGASAPAAAAAHFLAGLHTQDLYLAMGCGLRSEAAWRIFVATYRGYILAMARLFSANTDAACELADGVLADMFLPDRAGRSRIASYAGRSSLARWLQVIVTHRAINERKLRSNATQQFIKEAPRPEAAGVDRIEAAIRASRYDRMIGDSFRAACQTLTESERLVLVLRYEEQLRLCQIARLLDIHPSTVTRRLDQVQRKLRREVISIFVGKYHLGEEAIAECLADISENPSHSLLALIKQGGGRIAPESG